VGPITTSTGNGLSAGTIGGITGGILGVALLACIAVIFLWMGRQKKSSTAATGEMGEVTQGGRLGLVGREIESTDVGGRLKYLEEKT
jgi:hypothetical protein